MIDRFQYKTHKPVSREDHWRLLTRTESCHTGSQVTFGIIAEYAGKDVWDGLGLGVGLGIQLGLGLGSGQGQGSQSGLAVGVASLVR